MEQSVDRLKHAQGESKYSARETSIIERITELASANIINMHNVPPHETMFQSTDEKECIFYQDPVLILLL